MLSPLACAPQTYKQCFVGKDAADWLIKNSSKISSSADAEAIGNLLMGEPDKPLTDQTTAVDCYIHSSIVLVDIYEV